MDKSHYVSNKDLYIEYCKWHEAIKEAKRKKLPEPQMPNSIAHAIIKICNKLSNSYNFVNYSYKDEMIADAIENCFRTAKNFDVENYNNPFAFLTTIAYHAFMRRIKKEKQESIIKGELLRDMMLEDIVNFEDGSETEIANLLNAYETKREASHFPTNVKKVKVKQQSGKLEEFFE